MYCHDVSTNIMEFDNKTIDMFVNAGKKNINSTVASNNARCKLCVNCWCLAIQSGTRTSHATNNGEHLMIKNLEWTKASVFVELATERGMNNHKFMIFPCSLPLKTFSEFIAYKIKNNMKVHI